ncbi:MAG: AgmX/PglI C-terminal domain-containing protein [Gammaproteobacteria bacterium]|nr:AgmX/PglI C-terminal domain-containing protein [Gammaproteobacteria bacterium]
MTAAVIAQGYLPWNRNTVEERLFLKTLLMVLAVSLLLGLVVPWFDLPAPERDQVTAVPPRIARFLLERQRPPPPKVEVKRADKPLEEPKEEVKRVAAPKELNPARERAKKSGLLALADELSALRATDAASKARGAQTLSMGGADKAVRLGSNIISGASRGSGGIDTSGYSRDSGNGGALGDHTMSQAEAVNPSLVAVAEEEFKRKNQPRLRDAETVMRVLDSNKGRVYAIYNRALRKNPLLDGKLVLELTIDPSGRVSRCRVLSSELQDEELEQKLVARISMLDFGAEPVPPYKFEYPIEFLPS